MSDEIAIRVSNVSKDFVLPHEKVGSIKGLFTKAFRQKRTKETQHALKEVSFEVKKGEFFGIVGRNGSGKSTLLKILAGIYQPTSGNVETHGKLVPFIELGVGFNPELTGRENVYLNGAMLGFSEQEVEAMYDDIVEFAELERFMDQKLKNYSSGMQVRLAFSMATRSEADILLIDEVLAVGDADFQRKCFDYFKQLKKNNTTVVFVSHDMEAVREYCDRAVLIDNSRIVQSGVTASIAESYLKLFMRTSEAQYDMAKDDRWGEGDVVIEEVKVHVSEDTITIREKFKAATTINNPVPGFRVRDASGKEITGTNSKIERVALGDVKVGETRTVAWQFPNLLSDGEYTIDAAVLKADGITVCDWWNEAASFIIKKSRHLPYAVDPGFVIALE